jgi:hypothetical protein
MHLYIHIKHTKTVFLSCIIEQKATMSVTDVIVIEIPLCFMVSPIRVSISSLVEVDANPDSNTNISSTHIPVNTRIDQPMGISCSMG